MIPTRQVSCKMQIVVVELAEIFVDNLQDTKELPSQ